jgi:hypothetical protein
MPCFGGFVFIVYLIFGPYVYIFHTFEYSLKSVIFFILGTLDTDELVMSNTFMALAWSYAFFFFLVFIFISIFMAVFIVSFETTVRENGGYPEDFVHNYTWEYSDYLFWIIEQWTFESFQKRLRKKKPMEKDEDNAYNAIDDSILNHENIINDTNHT